VRTDSRNSDSLTDRAEEIFCAALEVTSLEERATFLQASCGSDAELRAAVEAMLCSQPEVENFFKHSTPAVIPNISQAITDSCGLPDDAAVLGDGAENEGKPIGPYKLLQKIGEGGCGVVYLAEQQSPVRRQVALKVIKLGMDTKRVIARFEAERQALALMDHPHIARVLDAGATEAGRPYFVMELVRGVKITRYCDEHCLDLHQRLGLFIQVCNAIQHAHQKGIVHRDIKPSNILVMNNDGVPVPKVIDFGISKATSGERLTDKTLFTAFEQFMGTPEYMSPEQAEMGNMDVDTRSDIYSLGVLLYELLTGKTPFEQNELLKSGLDQMRRTLREREPHRPSVRLEGLREDELTETALQRRVEPRKLRSLLTGDLDWIAMKALEKDRALRYQTANGLGMDAQRYLNSEPVVARPPNRFYRFRKLVRRNKAVFAAVSAVSLALILGFGTSSWLFVQEREARRQQVLLREDAERARASESRRRIEAEASAKIAEAAVLITRKKVGEADRLLEGVEIASIQPSLEAARVFRDLGCWNVTQGRWEQAADCFLKKQQLADAVDTSDLTDNATRDLPAIAIALIVANHSADYRQLIQKVGIHFAKTDNPIAAEHVLKISTYLPDQTNTLFLLEPLERIAEKSLVDAQNSSDESQCMLAWRALAVSMYYYRRGNFPSAIYWSRRCLNYKDTAATRTAMTHAVLALAEHRMNPAQGGAELEAARAIVDGKFPDHIIGISGVGDDALGFWNDWITALLLYQEADREIHQGIQQAKD
jgi:eukaryotic-like serine/threonine-protein kinase